MTWDCYDGILFRNLCYNLTKKINIFFTLQIIFHYLD